MSAKLDRPDQLAREFVRCASAGDLEGLVALYRDDTKVYFTPNKAATGHDEIREAIRKILETRPTFSDAGQRKTIVVGDLALTSAISGGERYTAEVAQRQPDGSWLWVIDHPNFTTPDYLTDE